MTSTCLSRVWALASVLLGALAAGCVSAAPDVGVPDDFPTFDQFRGWVHPDAEGRFVVDGDIAIYSEQGLRAFYQTALDEHLDEVAAAKGLGISRENLVVNTVSGIDDVQARADRFNLTYCVSSSFGANFDTVVATLDIAVRSWADRIGVRHRLVSTSTCDASTSVMFDVRPAPSDADYFASSFFPSYSRGMRELLIADAAFTTTSGGRDFQGILRHELGHTLGFRHEHILLNPSCTGEPATDSRQVTEYDVDSVMHYPQCRPSGTGGYRQSYLDYRGGNLLYGLAPALTTTVL
jgi:hypothetical protein